MASPEVERTFINRAISSNRDTVSSQEQLKPSLGFLQSAERFSINDGTMASIGGDSFTARGDVHVTINNNYPSNENQEPESETAYSSSIHTQRGTFSEDTFSRTPLPIQRSCDIYSRHLEAKGRGKCLWIPELSTNLPIQYQRTGITIGDVGMITPSGSFIFLFNVCLPRGHPTNPRKLPTGFEPIANDVIQEFNISAQRAFREHSYLASVSSVRVRRDGDSTGLVFESSEQDGAILTMPVGAKSEDLTNIVSFRKYVTANLASWYRYAYHVRGFEVRNGDLRVVTGTDKTSAWGMATFSNSAAGCSSTRQESASLVSGNEPKFHLEFGLIEHGAEASDRKLKRYGWEYSGVAEVRAGPDAREIAELRGDDVDEEDAVYENQCLFIRTLNATLPERVWEQLGIDEEEEANYGDGYGYHSMNDSNLGDSSSSSSSSSGEGGNGFNGSLNQGGSSSSSASHNHAAISTSARTSSIGPFSRTTPDYSSSIALADHPSNAINHYLLNHCSDDTSMAVTLDQDWISVLREDDCVLPSSEELLERIIEVYDVREEDGIVFFDAKCQNLDGTSHESPSLAILYSEDNIPEAVSEEPLASLEDFDLDIASTDPIISKCVSILKSTYHAIQNVKIHKQKCKDLCDRTKQLLQETQCLDIKEAPDIVNEIYHIITQIDHKAQNWGSWSRMKSSFRRGEVLQDIERRQVEIDDLARRISGTNAGLRPLISKGAEDRDKPGFEDQQNGPVPICITSYMEDPYPFGFPSPEQRSRIYVSPSRRSIAVNHDQDRSRSLIPYCPNDSRTIAPQFADWVPLAVNCCNNFSDAPPFPQLVAPRLPILPLQGRFIHELESPQISRDLGYPLSQKRPTLSDLHAKNVPDRERLSDFDPPEVMKQDHGRPVHPCWGYPLHLPTKITSSLPSSGHCSDILPYRQRMAQRSFIPQHRAMYGDTITPRSPLAKEYTHAPPSIDYAPSYRVLGFTYTSVRKRVWDLPAEARVSHSGCTPPPTPISTRMIHPILGVAGHDQISLDVNFSSGSTWMLGKGYRANARFSSWSDSLKESMIHQSSISGSESDHLFPAAYARTRFDNSHSGDHRYKEVKKEVLCPNGSIGLICLATPLSRETLGFSQKQSHNDYNANPHDGHDDDFSNFYNSDDSLNTDERDSSSSNMENDTSASLVVTNAGTVPLETNHVLSPTATTSSMATLLIEDL